MMSSGARQGTTSPRTSRPRLELSAAQATPFAYRVVGSRQPLDKRQRPRKTRARSQRCTRQLWQNHHLAKLRRDTKFFEERVLEARVGLTPLVGEGLSDLALAMKRSKITRLRVICSNDYDALRRRIMPIPRRPVPRRASVAGSVTGRAMVLAVMNAPGVPSYA